MKDDYIEYREGEIPVKVKVAGICRTDIEIINGYFDFEGVPGHEFVGVALDGKFKGKRVVGDINCSCGGCEFCLAGLPHHCRNRTVLGIYKRDGAFQEILHLPEENLLEIPEDLEDEKAVFAEPLAAALRITEQVRLENFESILVLGDGKLGALCAMAAWACSGNMPILVGHHQEKVERIKDKGINAVLEKDARLKPHSFDLVIEATGSGNGLASAIEYAMPTGTIIMKSTIHGEFSLNLTSMVVDEIKVIGSRCGPMDLALEYLSSGMIDPSFLVDGIYPLEEWERAFEKATQKESLKVLLRI